MRPTDFCWWLHSMRDGSRCSRAVFYDNRPYINSRLVAHWFKRLCAILVTQVQFLAWLIPIQLLRNPILLLPSLRFSVLHADTTLPYSICKFVFVNHCIYLCREVQVKSYGTLDSLSITEKLYSQISLKLYH